jgi:hypothetical protein
LHDKESIQPVAAPTSVVGASGHVIDMANLSILTRCDKCRPGFAAARPTAVI